MEKENTGRYYVKDTESGRTFCVEPIDNSVGKQQLWGDVNPATKKLEGNYGEKFRGSIPETESVITKENGFTDIGYAKNPNDYIEQLLKK